MHLRPTVLMFAILSGCDNPPESQPVTLYNGTVTAGNGVVHFVSHNDPNGINSMKHCEALKSFYESSDSASYVCSSVVFKDFVPRAEWKIAK